MHGIDLDTPPHATRVVVAMSGGVDSSVTAALVAEAGYDVVGVTLQLYDHGAAVRRPGACCAGQDIHDARDVAERIGIPHYVLNYEDRFRQSVIDEFADSYLRGETPIPCVSCNQTVKFRDLLATARDLGAAALCTGHYVQRIAGPDGVRMRMAVDRSRDQSYFLFATTRAQLEFLRFPLGAMEKRETREHARRFGLEVAGKPDSQDICFVPNGRYADVVRRLRPGSVTPGEIVHVDGTVLGTHNGVIDYTVGQRRGIGIGGRKSGAGQSEPLYVVRIEPAAHRVVVGPRAALARHEVALDAVNWLDPRAPGRAGIRCLVRFRSTQVPVPAEVRSEPDGGGHVRFPVPQYGISPGQALVCYRDDGTVLGGGWIRALRDRTPAGRGGLSGCAASLDAA